jgi:hypothetical protein
MVRSEKMAMEDGHFFFLFLGIKILANFDPKIAKLVEFQIGEISKIFSISL